MTNMVQDVQAMQPKKCALVVALLLSIAVIQNIVYGVQSLQQLQVTSTSAKMQTGDIFAGESMQEVSVFAKDDDALCPVALLNVGAGNQSVTIVWHSLKSSILRATYNALPTYNSLNKAQRFEYEHWINALFAFYDPKRLRRTVMNPAPSTQMTHIMSLAAEVKAHNKNVTDESQKRTIRVLVLGGSVTLGIGCVWPEGFGIAKPRFWATPGEKCAWSYRLEVLLNDVLFAGEKVVEITNMANGGDTSAVGAMILETRLFPENTRVPDIIVSSYSANEAQEADKKSVLYGMQQDLVKAAQSLHPCNGDAPLVILVDDFYGDMPFEAIHQSGRVFMVSSWNNVMAVNYASALKYKIHAEAQEGGYEPLLFSDFQIHLGVGMHIGLAWTVLFNIINSLVNVCNDIELEIGGGGHEIEINGTATSLKVDPALLNNTQSGEPPFQNIGYFGEGRGSVSLVQHDLLANVNASTKLCNLTQSNGGNSKKCPYVWYVNYRLGYTNKNVLGQQMEKVLIANDG